MPEHQLPRSGQPDQNTPAPKALPDDAAFLPLGNDTPARSAHFPDGEEDIHLASESVAGEEDPGASLDIPAGVSFSGGNTVSEMISPAPSPLGQGHERSPMKSISYALAPNVLAMIRMDHTHVLATFHQYKTTSRPNIKLGLVNTTCLALEVHAQLEDEIFYPAMREVSDSEVLRKSGSEHDEMRRLIALLRGMEPEDTRYDDTYMELMRHVMHHLADEETLILPEAERLLQDQLGALGSKMMKRRMELVAPRTKDMAVNLARAMPGPSMAMLAGATLAGVLLGRRWMRN